MFEVRGPLLLWYCRFLPLLHLQVLILDGKEWWKKD